MWLFGKKKQKEQNGGEVKSDATEKEFSLIWYKKMQVGNKTHYTAPFRTKIKAKTRKEAVDKLTSFALNKMTLCVHEEKDFHNSDLSKMQQTFDRMSIEMDKFFNKFKVK